MMVLGLIMNQKRLAGELTRPSGRVIERSYHCSSRTSACMYVCIVRAGVQSTLDPYAKALGHQLTSVTYLIFIVNFIDAGLAGRSEP